MRTNKDKGETNKGLTNRQIMGLTMEKDGQKQLQCESVGLKGWL